MRVDIEESHLDIYKKLAEDINNAAKKFKIKLHKISPGPYQALLSNTNITIEKKKKGLVGCLHRDIVKTFSVDISRVSSKNALLEGLKNNLVILRAIVNKLRSINHYLEESLLKEIGIVKKSSGLSILNSKNPEKVLIKKNKLGKKDMEKLEHAVYSLIEKVIFLDKRLLKGYEKREENIIKRKKAEIKDIEGILKKESEILMHLEAKLPPAGKVSQNLIKNSVVHHWIARIFALLSGFENEYQKENGIFHELKSNERIRNKINKKIRHIIKEKEKLLKIKEQRALSMEKLKVDNEWRLAFHQFNAASRL